MIWTLHDVLTATGGTMINDADGASPINGIDFDSRKIAPNDLFLAFKGAHSDGHDYLNAAHEGGALAAIVDHEVDSAITQIIVSDVHQALWGMARSARARTEASIIAITGSVGKTGTRDLMASCLAGMGKTHATAGNYNNQIGAPLSLARMPIEAEYGVFELGMDHAGEIAELSPLVLPDIAVITKIAESHIGYFDSLEGIARAKAEIFDGLKPDGLVLLNADDDFTPLLTRLAREKGAGRVMTIGTHGDADARIDQIDHREAGYEVTALIAGQKITFTLGMSAVHWIHSALMSLAAVHYLGGDIHEAAAQLADHKEMDGRGARHQLKINDRSITLIDDSYNASPASMAAGIANLGMSNITAKGRKIAVLADMLELGDAAEHYHRALATDLATADIDILICFGPLMAGLADAASQPDQHTLQIHHCADADSALEIILSIADDGDVVLVKGSNGMKAHHIAKALTSRNQNAHSHKGDPHAA